MTDDNLELEPREKADNWNMIKCGQTDLPSQLHKEIWNRAIEKAAELSETKNAPQFWITDEIRKLKV